MYQNLLSEWCTVTIIENGRQFKKMEIKDKILTIIFTEYFLLNLFYHLSFVDFAFYLFIEEEDDLDIITSILSFFVKIIGIQYFSDMILKQN